MSVVFQYVYMLTMSSLGGITRLKVVSATDRAACNLLIYAGKKPA